MKKVTRQSGRKRIHSPVLGQYRNFIDIPKLMDNSSTENSNVPMLDNLAPLADRVDANRLICVRDLLDTQQDGIV